METEQFKQAFERVETELGKAVLGQPDVVRATLVALFARGHVLLQGLPGLGKTLLVRALAEVLGLSFRRVQFTPDLMPSDITGTNVYRQDLGRFEFREGPVFAQLLLADEVNRAPAKTQAALLEAMQERSVTTDGVTRALPEPFLVLATQNPIESQGTYPLPEAQLDRFLLRVDTTYPDADVERAILARHVAGFDSARISTAGLSRVVDAATLAAMHEHVATLTVAPELLEYIVAVIRKTRDHTSISVGASPRAAVGLLAAARAHAAAEGRNYVSPDDVKALAPAVLRHRLQLEPNAELEGMTADDCLEAVLQAVPAPSVAT